MPEGTSGLVCGAVSEEDGWRDWVVFFLRGVAVQSRDAIHRARRLQDLQREWRKTIIAAKGSAYQLHLADLLFEQPVISIPEARHRLDTTYLTARTTVAKLVSLGILRQAAGSEYGKRFVCDPTLAITGVNVAERENHSRGARTTVVRGECIADYDSGPAVPSCAGGDNRL